MPIQVERLEDSRVLIRTHNIVLPPLNTEPHGRITFPTFVLDPPFTEISIVLPRRRQPSKVEFLPWPVWDLIEEAAGHFADTDNIRNIVDNATKVYGDYALITRITGFGREEHRDYVDPDLLRILPRSLRIKIKKHWALSSLPVTWLSQINQVFEHYAQLYPDTE